MSVGYTYDSYIAIKEKRVEELCSSTRFQVNFRIKSPSGSGVRGTLVQQKESFVGVKGWNPFLGASPPNPHVAKFGVCNTSTTKMPKFKDSVTALLSWQTRKR